MRQRKGNETVATRGPLMFIIGLPIILVLLASAPALGEASKIKFLDLKVAVVRPPPILVKVPVASHQGKPAIPHSKGNRAVDAADLLPEDVFADGEACSIGCRPVGAIDGWPLKPFHQQHPLRAGLNEIRPGSLHVGLDIQARDGAKVYAIQPGYAVVERQSGYDWRVRVGNYTYWHIKPEVTNGELVEPYKTELGTVLSGFGHIAFSEQGPSGEYLNPLRPGGRVLAPYVQTQRPVISRPVVDPEGAVTVTVAAPQSFVRKTTYWTPILAPAALAYRIWSIYGQPLTPLEFALRSTRVYPLSDLSLIYTPRAHEAGFSCFATRERCNPFWEYNLAGGLAPRIEIPEGAETVRLSVYAWDYAGNASAYDLWLRETSTGIKVVRSPLANA